jgi:hypothetical protein
MSIVRVKSDKAAALDKIIVTGQPDTFQARGYELQIYQGKHGSRILAAGHFFGNVAERSDRTDKEMKQDRVEAYQIIDELLPELIGKGERKQGFIRYTLEEVQQSGVMA